MGLILVLVTFCGVGSGEDFEDYGKELNSEVNCI